MLRLSFARLSRTQHQLMVQGLYLLIGLLLIIAGVQCLDAERIALRHQGSPAPKICTLK